MGAPYVEYLATVNTSLYESTLRAPCRNSGDRDADSDGFAELAGHDGEFAAQFGRQQLHHQ